MVTMVNRIWGVVAVVSGGMGAGLAWLILPAVSWTAVAGGWIVVLVNSLAGRLINRRAIGATKGAFLRWGIGANACRLLTLVGIFAYILRSYRAERGAFFISAFTVFFSLLIVEVIDLLKCQANDGVKFERINANKLDGCREFGAGKE